MYKFLKVILLSFSSDNPSQLKSLLDQRLPLDRRRLEEAVLLQACLHTIAKYDLWLKVPAMPYDKNEMVELVTKEFAKSFQQKWGGKQDNQAELGHLSLFPHVRPLTRKKLLTNKLTMDIITHSYLQ